MPTMTPSFWPKSWAVRVTVCCHNNGGTSSSQWILVALSERIYLLLVPRMFWRPCWCVACCLPVNFRHETNQLFFIIFKSRSTKLNERLYSHVSPFLSSHCSARHYASRLMLQGAGLRRRQVTWISIKGIIDVGTAEREKQHIHVHIWGKNMAANRQCTHKKTFWLNNFKTYREWSHLKKICVKSAIKKAT